MAKNAAAAIEFSEEEGGGSVRVPIRFASHDIPSGAEVSIQFYTAGKSRKIVSLTEQSDGSFTGEIDVPQGSYKYRFVVKEPGTAVRFIPDRGFRTHEAKEASTDTSQGGKKSAKLTDVEKEVRERMKDILLALRTSEGAEGFHAAIEDMEHWLETRGLTGDQKGVLFSALVALMREADWLPAVIKQEFRDALPPPRNFGEWKQRIEKGSRNFRKSVFLKLKQNKDAREYFGIREASYDHDNPLGSAKYNKVFARLCVEAGDMSDSAEIIGQVMDRFSGVSATNPDIANRLRQKQEEYLARLKPEEGGALAKMPPKKLGKNVDLAFQAAVVAGGFATGTILVPAAMLFGKEFLHELLGVSMDDVVRFFQNKENRQAKDEFLKVLKGNNLATQEWKAKESLWEILKARLKGALKRSIPGAPLFMNQRRPRSFTGEFPDDLEAPEEKAEQLIRAAVEAARK